jgi:hypothetical protein
VRRLKLLLLSPFRALCSLLAALPLPRRPRPESGVSAWLAPADEEAFTVGKAIGDVTLSLGDREGAGVAAAEGSLPSSSSSSGAGLLLRARRLARLMRSVKSTKGEGSGLLQAAERTDSGVWALRLSRPAAAGVAAAGMRRFATRPGVSRAGRWRRLVASASGGDAKEHAFFIFTPLTVDNLPATGTPAFSLPVGAKLAVFFLLPLAPVFLLGASSSEPIWRINSTKLKRR